MSKTKSMEHGVQGLVRSQQEQFGLNYVGAPRHLLSLDEDIFYMECLREELEEYNSSNTIVDDYDALLDIVVFAVGALSRMGLPLLEGLQVVVECNKQKTLGPNAKRGDFALDLVKPTGWVGPEVKLQAIIDRLMGEKQDD